MPVTGLIYREAEIMSCFAVLTAGGESEILPTDWGAKHPDGRVCKSYPAERRRDNPSEGEFIKVRYSIHNHTFWTKLDLCETMFALYSACPVSEFASALFPLLWSWSVTQTHAVLRTPQTNLFFFYPPCVHMYMCRCEEARAAAERASQEMSDNLRRITQDKQSFDLRTAAELDDLYRTKINLEERLVELIR